MHADAVCGHYSIGMMAEVLGVSAAALRHWRRRSLLEPVRRSGTLEWFDYGELVVARRLTRLLEAGLSLREIDHQLERLLPEGRREAARGRDPLFVEGGRLFIRRDGCYRGAGGQLAFAFAVAEPIEQRLSVSENAGGYEPGHVIVGLVTDAEPLAAESEGWETADELLALAADLESGGHLVEAAEALRAVLQSQPPTPQLAFLLAELLYRSGDLTAARERYYMAVELDHDHLEARTSLGCVLSELGDHELARAALEGVVRQEPDHAEAHWHLAGVLEATGHAPEAARHLLIFLGLAPHSPWAEVARSRLAAQGWSTHEPAPG